MEKARRILFINYEYPPLGGGGGHANQKIAIQLAQKGHQVTVLTSRFQNLLHQEWQQGVRVIRIPTWRRYAEKCRLFEMLIFLLSSLLFSVWYARQTRPQVVISFFSLPSGPAALLLKMIFGIPYILSLRGGDVPGFLPEQMKWSHRLTNWLTWLLWRQAKTVIANSQGLYQLARQFCLSCPIQIIPNGCDDQFFYQRSDQKTKTDLQVLAVGRLSYQKRFDRLLRVFAELSKRRRGAISLTIVGDGPERSSLTHLADQYGVLEKTVFFQGWCDRQEIPKLYQKADVLCLTSDFEGMPNVILEAMASSLAILSTRAPGTEELVRCGENGYRFAKGDILKMAEVLCEWHDQPELLKAMQSQSYQHVLSYTWKRSARLYEQLCRYV